jgi:AraC-like DNA-binding protein
VDILDGVLDGPRARNVFVLRSLLEPPWALRICDEAPLTIVAMVRGQAWVTHDGHGTFALAEHDVAIIRGPGHYTVADHLDTAPQIVIHPGQRCTTPDGVDLHEAMTLGAFSWGNDPNGSTVMLTGTYQLEGEVSTRLLAAIPTSIVVEAGSTDRHLIGLLERELTNELPGQRAMLDRLVDLLLIATLRNWFNRSDAQAPSWFRANADPVVGHAMRLIHDQPAHRWTVANLAGAVGVSRASLAHRFSELVGEPPMTYLTEWRLALAADLLLEPGTTVSSVAPQVGYATPFALSAAFKRRRGISPSRHRLAAADA